MSTLFDPSIASEMKRRVASLTASSPRVWGKMSVDQAMAHCAVPLEWALDVTPHPPRALAGYLFAGMARKKVFGNAEPMGRNAPTAPQLRIREPRDLAVEQRRVVDLIDRFSNGGREAMTKGAHTFFGYLSPDEWGVLMFKHLDHHLRQFGG